MRNAFVTLPQAAARAMQLGKCREGTGQGPAMGKKVTSVAVPPVIKQCRISGFTAKRSGEAAAAHTANYHPKSSPQAWQKNKPEHHDGTVLHH